MFIGQKIRDGNDSSVAESKNQCLFTQIKRHEKAIPAFYINMPLFSKLIMVDAYLNA
jgi:hypothetical protein